MPHLVVGTAGHIDHGKSTLVLALTGTDPDRLREEKARGISIDLGFAHWQRDDVTVAFVDVPGHERFIKNMLAGVGGIDAVLLVVAADEGVMPQTREHMDICRLLAVPRGVIAITKADLVEPDMLELVQLDVAELVADTSLCHAPMIAVSATSGLGVEALMQALVVLASSVPERDDAGAVRLPVDRVFSVRGFGTVATGTLASGRLALDATLEVAPGGRPAKVRGLQVHGAQRDKAVAGERVAINLSGAEVADVMRGHVLVSPGTLAATSMIDVDITVLPLAPPLKHGARVRFHHGTAEILARVSTVGPAVDGVAPVIDPRRHGVARLRMESPAPVTRGDRFVLRSYSPPVTIAGGRVLDPSPPRTGVRGEAMRQRLERLRTPLDGHGGEDDALLLFVVDGGARGVRESSLMARAGAHNAAGHVALATLRDRPEVWQVGDRLVDAAWRQVLADAVTAALTEHHDRQPLSEGMPREEVRERILGRAHADVATAILDLLETAGSIRGRERLALRGRGVTLTPEEAAAQTALVAAYSDAGLSPPERGALSALTGLTGAVVDRMTQLLIRQQVLVKVDAFVFHRDALARLKAGVGALKADGPARVDVAGFKDQFGLTRKYAIPLLEYLDRERVTRREGDSRVVL